MLAKENYKITLVIFIDKLYLNLKVRCLKKLFSGTSMNWDRDIVFIMFSVCQALQQVLYHSIL